MAEQSGGEQKIELALKNVATDSTQFGLTVAEYMLTPNISEEEQDKFKQFAVMYCNVMALGNIERWERFAMVCAFEEICILLEWGAYERAHQLMAIELMMMQSSRSIGAIGLLYGFRGVDRKEIIEGGPGVQKKKSLSSRIVSAIKPGG